MNWKPNRTDKKLIYKQIAYYIEEGISSGTFPADSLLPSERTLAAELEVNRSTVVAAYEELQSLGIVESSIGKGYSTISKVCNGQGFTAHGYK
ncbi:winged helix-turn-helix domain-containing protein [Priestia filamentosa]|nr:winged helix-turn-helix domain-containing protein [Priestia filamentosa]